jgi:hypothetical protein
VWPKTTFANAKRKVARVLMAGEEVVAPWIASNVGCKEVGQQKDRSPHRREHEHRATEP